MYEHDVEASLLDVRRRIAATGRTPMLVAVSKTKPAELIQRAFDAQQRDFGENYVQELVEKAPELPDAIRWHFIGHLQTNKVKDLLKVPNLSCVHTVDSLKLAYELEKRAQATRPDRPLDVFVQINTSGEESKSGCTSESAPGLCKEIVDSCPTLRLIGLMCIGKYSAAEGGSEDDFSCLNACRDEVGRALGIGPESLALSMGMSHDFEAAAAFGATHVRVGSTIFGMRATKVVQ